MYIKFFIMTFVIPVSIFAQDIYVKYRGNVDIDNGHFSKMQLSPSNVVKDIYYDENHEYLIVRLKNTYYHYCSIPTFTVKQWTNAPSLGRYYNSFIRGNYDCRINPIPKY